MNPLIEEYFDETEVCLIASQAVTSYTLVRREVVFWLPSSGLGALIC